MSSLHVSAPSKVAGGTIAQCQFVKVDPTNDYQVLAAGPGDLTIGISQRWANTPTFDDQTSTPPAAILGQGVTIYGPGVECQLLAGAGGWKAGDLLKPAAGNTAIVAAAGDKAGARALQECKAGVLGQVTVVNLTV